MADIEEVSVPKTEDVKQEVDSSPTQAVTADSAASVDATSESPDADRAALVKQLMQPDPVEEKPEAKTEEPADTAEDDLEPELEDDAKAPEKDAETSDDDTDLLRDPNVKEKTKKDFTRLRDRAKFGELITEVLTNAKISPQEFTTWTNLAARLKKGDPTAVNELIATAKNFGYKEPVAAPAEQEPDIDVVTERIYKTQFKEDVDSLLMDESAARRHARKAAESAVKDRPSTAHSQSNNVPAQQQPQQQRPMDPIRDRALQVIDQMEVDYRKKVPNYSTIEKTVQERMIREHASTDPLMWTAGFQSIVQDEIRKQAKPVTQRAPIKPLNETIIRPNPTSAKPNNGLTEREKLARSML